MKRFIIMLALMGVMVAMSPSTAMAASPDVNATVTARLVSVLVTENNVAYGVLDAGDADEEPTGQNCSVVAAPATSAFTVLNNGNADQDFDITGFNSGNWNLLGTAAEDVYVHRFSTTSNPCVFTGNEIATGGTTLTTDVVKDDSVETYLNLDMPTVTAISVEQTLKITITALAATP